MNQDDPSNSLSSGSSGSSVNKTRYVDNFLGIKFIIFSPQKNNVNFTCGEFQVFGSRSPKSCEAKILPLGLGRQVKFTRPFWLTRRGYPNFPRSNPHELGPKGQKWGTSAGAEVGRLFETERDGKAVYVDRKGYRFGAPRCDVNVG